MRPIALMSLITLLGVCLNSACAQSALTGGPIPVDPHKPDGRVYPGYHWVEGALPVGRGTVSGGAVVSPSGIHQFSTGVSVPVGRNNSVNVNGSFSTQPARPASAGIGFQRRF